MVLCIWSNVYHQKAQEVRKMNKAMTFEMTYTRYPFAPLVELGLALAAWFKGKTNSPSHVSGAIGHAA